MQAVLIICLKTKKLSIINSNNFSNTKTLVIEINIYFQLVENSKYYCPVIKTLIPIEQMLKKIDILAFNYKKIKLSQMIKKISLIAFMSLFMGLGAQAQSLVNTAWTINMQGSAVNIRFSATGIEINGSPIATFTETAGSLTVTDLNPANCGRDVGVYSTTYSGNTVVFGITTEPCTGRGDFFTTGPFTQTNISVFEAAKFAMTTVFPNPANDVINLDINEGFDGENYVIYTIQGQLVSEGTLFSGTNTISISGLKAGLYQVKLKDNALAVIKFVKL